MKKTDLKKKVTFISGMITMLITFTTMQCLASCKGMAGNDKAGQELTTEADEISQTDAATQVNKISDEPVYLKLDKEYRVQGIKFTVQKVKIHKGSYPMGMFSGRPSNPDMDPSYDGVLGIELTLIGGDSDSFTKLEKYLVNEKGERNVKEDMMSMSNPPQHTILFNVPMSAKKIRFGIGNLELDLEKVLND